MLLEGGVLGGLAALVGVGLVAWFFLNLLGAFAVGALARFLLPGADAIGWPTTILVGFVGGIVGNVLGRLLGMLPNGPIASFLASVAGAILVLFAYRTWRTKKGPAPAR